MNKSSKMDKILSKLSRENRISKGTVVILIAKGIVYERDTLKNKSENLKDIVVYNLIKNINYYNK